MGKEPTKGELVLWTTAKVLVIKKYIEPVIKFLGVKARVHPQESRPDINPHDVCVVMGQKLTGVLQADGLVPKNRKVGSLRGQPIFHNNPASTLITFDPTVIEFDYPRRPEIEWDLVLAARLLRTGQIKPVLGEYKWVKDFADCIDEIQKMFKKTQKPVPISIDLETVGLDPWGEDVFIVSIALTYKKGHSSVIRFFSPHDKQQPARWISIVEPDPMKSEHEKLNEVLWDQIYWLNNSEMVAVGGANYKFDMTWMSCHWGLHNFESYKMDTTVVGSLMDENRSNSLNTHTKIYLPDLGGYDDDLNQNYDKARMDLIPDQDLLPYAGGDTDANLQVRNIQKNQLLKDKRLTGFYVNLLHPALKAFQVIESRGVFINRDRFLSLKDEVEADIDKRRERIFGLMSRRILLKYSDNLSLGRPALLNEFLFTPRGLNLKPLMTTAKTGAPSTSMDHLEMLIDEHPNKPELKVFVEEMREHNSAVKTLGTYIDGFMKHIRADGKFHPTYMIHRGDYEGGGESGTVTGRTSCKDPALQTLPKHTAWTKKLREVYVPPPGHVIMNVDYSQGELRVVACVANEKTMIAAYKQGIDLHAVTSARMMGLELEDFYKLPPEIQKEKRFLGKAANFGLLYGLSPPGFVEYARFAYKVVITLDESTLFRQIFLEESYPGLTHWHEKNKAFSHRHGYIRSPLGRVRHLPLINVKDNATMARQERQGVNFEIQSTLSDLGLYAAAELNIAYPDLYCFGFTHDALSFYIPEDEVMEWAVRIKHVMENLPLKEKFGWSPQLKFVVDVEVGKESLADCEEIAIAA